MPGNSLKDLRVAVAGGSLGGLCAGVALRGQGAKVDIFERNLGEMEARGAGIVVQQELTRILQRHGAQPLPTTSCVAGGISISMAATARCNQCRRTSPRGKPSISPSGPLSRTRTITQGPPLRGSRT